MGLSQKMNILMPSTQGGISICPEKRDEIITYDIPLWNKPIMSVAEAAMYTGLSANKIYEMTSDEKCPFVIWVGSRRVIKRKSFEKYLERQYSI